MRAKTLKVLLVSSILTFGFNSSVFSSEIHLPTIAQIESSNNPNAISFRGAKFGRGLYMVSEILLSEYNTLTKHNYTTEDLFDKKINEQIARWYFFVRIPQMLRAYKLDVNDRNILCCYNWGIGNLKLKGIASIPNETKNYILKYETARGVQVRLASPLPVSVSH
jgi:hypothetical protein